MKKTLVTLVAILISTNLFAQDYKINDDKYASKHHFGLGVSTNLFSSSEIDGYVHNISEDQYLSSMNETCSFPVVVEQYAFAIFAEYQYDIDEWNSLAVRLRWNYRHLDYKMFMNPNEVGNFGVLNMPIALNNLQIPFMYGYTFHKGNKSLFKGIVGLGVDCSLSKELSMPTFKLVRSTSSIDGSELYSSKQDGGEFKLDRKTAINPFLTFGLAMAKGLCNNHKIEAGLMFDFYPIINNYQYKIITPSETTKESYNPTKFANHNLSVYVAYYL